MADTIAVDFEKLLTGTTFEIKNKQTPEEKSVADEKVDEIEKYATAVAAQANYDLVNHNDDQTPFQTIAMQMVNLLPDGKIKKRIIREGYGAKPTLQDTVKINYNAYVEYESIPFDSTYSRRQALCFSVSDAGVIDGLLIAVRSMNLCEKSQFLIEPEFAYKDSGYGRLPPNSVVLFEIELDDISLTPENIKKDNTNGEDQTEFLQTYKECLYLGQKAKEIFCKGNIKTAIKEYQAVIRKFEMAVLADYEDQIVYDKFLMRLLSNLLVCYTCANEPKRGCSAANRIYELAKNGNVNVPAKVFYNNAKCIRMLGDYQQAERKLMIALKMEQNNGKIKEELKLLRQDRLKNEESVKDVTN